MNVTLVAVIVSVVIGVISSETCSNDSHCIHVTCGDSSRLACSHGVCTCLVAANAGTCLSETCSARDDCDSCQCRQTHANHPERHCFDGHCLCGHAGVGPGVGK